MSHLWHPVKERGVVGRRCPRCRTIVAVSSPADMTPGFARAGFSIVFIPPNLDGSPVTNMQADLHAPPCRRPPV